MTKTKITRQIERALWQRLVADSMNVFGAFEVTVGYTGYQVRGYDRADFVTCDTDGTIRAYEIKTSVEDFHSDAKLSWCGKYNYYALSRDVYEQVKDELKSWSKVGIYVYDPLGAHGLGNLTCVRKAKQTTISVGQRVEVVESMLKAASRDAGKLFKQDSYWRIEGV